MASGILDLDNSTAVANAFAKRQPKLIDKSFDNQLALLAASPDSASAWNLMMSGGMGMADMLGTVPTSYGMNQNSLANLSALSNSIGNNGPVLGASSNIDTFGQLAKANEALGKQYKQQAQAAGAMGELGSNELSQINNVANSPIIQNASNVWSVPLGAQAQGLTLSNYAKGQEFIDQGVSTANAGYSPYEQAQIASDPGVRSKIAAAINKGEMIPAGENKGAAQQVYNNMENGIQNVPVSATVADNATIVGQAANLATYYSNALDSTMKTYNENSNMLDAVIKAAGSGKVVKNGEGQPIMVTGILNTALASVLGGPLAGLVTANGAVGADILKAATQASVGQEIPLGEGVSIKKEKDGSNTLNISAVQNNLSQKSKDFVLDYAYNQMLGAPGTEKILAKMGGIGKDASGKPTPATQNISIDTARAKKFISDVYRRDMYDVGGGKKVRYDDLTPYQQMMVARKNPLPLDVVYNAIKDTPEGAK